MTTDPKSWPVVECESADVFLGSFGHDCTAQLTDEQRSWTVVNCTTADVLVETENDVRDQLARQLRAVQDTQRQLAAQISRMVELFTRLGPAPSRAG